MKVTINGEERNIIAATVMQLAQELGLPERGVAIAINNKISPRALWSETMLSENDEVTVIKAAFGG